MFRATLLVESESQNACMTGVLGLEFLSRPEVPQVSDGFL